MSHHENEEIQEQSYETGYDEGYAAAVKEYTEVNPMRVNNIVDSLNNANGEEVLTALAMLCEGQVDTLIKFLKTIKNHREECHTEEK